MFEFNVTLDDEDYLQFNQYHLLNSPIGKKTLMSYKYSMPCLSFMAIIIFCIASAELYLIITEAIGLTLLSIWWVLNSNKRLLKKMRTRIVKLKKSGRLPYSNEAILKFEDEIIHELTPNTETKTKYSLIEKIAVTENAIYIFTSTVQAFIIPLTVFSEEVEREKFLEFINKKII